MLTLAQMKMVVSLAETIETWIEKHSDSEDWQEVSGWLSADLYERMALAALLPVFQSKADQDYLRENEILKEE